jgi:hypothetical protein
MSALQSQKQHIDLTLPDAPLTVAREQDSTQ